MFTGIRLARAGVPRDPGPGRAEAWGCGMVVIGTWNLENLYRPGGQFGPKNQAAYDLKLTTLAATITAANPDVLAVQEVGEPAALEDLVTRLPGSWHTSLSPHPDARGIRVGFLTRTAPATAEQVVDFPAPLRPVQVGDGPTDEAVGMGRGALHIHLDDLGGHPWDLVTVHLKSKLLSFPGGRFNPTDENERARFAAYAQYRRAAEAATVRVAATGILDGHGQDPPAGRAGRPERHRAGRHHPAVVRAARLPVRHRRLQPSRPGRRGTLVEPGAADPAGAPLLPHL